MLDALPQPRAGRAVAIVAGASGDAGRALVLELTRRGSAVMLAYLDDPPGAQAVVDAVQTQGGTALAARADLTDPLDVERLFDETIAVFGVVDVVVGAARQPPRAVVEEAARRGVPAAWS